MDAIWHKVLRTNINMINNVMNFSSNFKNQNINNNIPQNAMDKYVINNVVIESLRPYHQRVDV